jgi:hypothetical protein
VLAAKATTWWAVALAVGPVSSLRVLLADQGI